MRPIQEEIWLFADLLEVGCKLLELTLDMFKLIFGAVVTKFESALRPCKSSRHR